MLVLCRKDGQRIRIGPDIEVVLVRSRTGEARLGIEAPRDVIILRDELEPSEGIFDGKQEGTPVG